MSKLPATSLTVGHLVRSVDIVSGRLLGLANRPGFVRVLAMRGLDRWEEIWPAAEIVATHAPDDYRWRDLAT